MRDDEDTWARSMYNQVAAANNPQIQILYMLSPTLKQARAWSDKVGMKTKSTILCTVL